MSKTISGNPSFMRDMNRASVMDTIRRMGPISQADLAKLLAVQPSTILRIVTDLIQEELIRQTGKGKAGSSGGRRAVMLEINAEGAYSIGVDLGSDEIVAVLLNLSGTVVDEVKKNSPSESGAIKVMEVLEHVITDLLSRNVGASMKVKGIGVSVPGKVDSDAGISVYAVNFHDWKNVAIGQQLENKFKLPVYVEHDMRSMAFGEMWFGGDYRNMLCLGFRRGIGLGIVINGELYRGSSHFAGDLGHVIADSNGPLCSCGRNGCLETLSSEKAILKKVRIHLQDGFQNKEKEKEITIQDIYDAVNRGDPIVTEIVKEASGYIANVLSDLVRIFDPEKIVIGGDIIAYSSEFLQSIRSKFLVTQPNYAEFIPDIEAASFGNKSIAIGSAALILAELFRPSGVNSLREVDLC